MKRIVSILVVLTMLLTFPGCGKKEEAVFRDIPWGSSYEEVIKKAPELKMGELNYQAKGVSEQLNKILSNWFDEDIKINNPEISGYSYAGLSDNKVEVAGYELKVCVMHFIHNFEKDSDHLIAAGYTFSEFDDHDSAFEDLKSKLIQKYGEPSENTDGEFSDGETERRVVWDYNDSKIVLMGSYLTGLDEYHISVRYSSKNAVEWIHEADESASNNVSGL